MNLQKRNLEPIPTYDTAGAVKIIKEKKLNDAASKQEAEIFMEWKFGRRISKIKQIIIPDFSLYLNTVRAHGNDGTSLIFSVKHVPGLCMAYWRNLPVEVLTLPKLNRALQRRSLGSTIFMWISMDIEMINR